MAYLNIMFSTPPIVRYPYDLLGRCLIVVKAVSTFISIFRTMPCIFLFPPEIKSSDEYVEGGLTL
ncbi:hypothetical protein N9E40_02205 [Amylibacter sp.]|nr:hypothetical protein [Amylibacter sp.]